MAIFRPIYASTPMLDTLMCLRRSSYGKGGVCNLASNKEFAFSARFRLIPFLKGSARTRATNYQRVYQP